MRGPKGRAVSLDWQAVSQGEELSLWTGRLCLRGTSSPAGGIMLYDPADIHL